MTKADMIRQIQLNVGIKITQTEIKAVLDTLDQAIIDVISREDSYVFNWGVVRGIKKSARTGINPKNGEPILWPEKITGKCTFGKAISNMNINKG